MKTLDNPVETLSPNWRKGVIWTIVVGMAVLLFISATAYKNAPPIPGGVVDPKGQMIFTGKEILAGQEVFLKYALMENGTVWGHGAYLGPDFSAEYLHTLALDARDVIAIPAAHRERARRRYGGSAEDAQAESL